MLRVLKPGGVLITTGDSYVADTSPDEAELAIFNAHPGVLVGINEQTPRLKEFIDVIVRRRAQLKPRLFTQIVYGGGAFGRTLEGFREWRFDGDAKKLRTTSGSLAMKIKLVQPISEEAPKLAPKRTLRPNKVAEWLSSDGVAMAELAAWAPDSVVNADFPGSTGSKLEMLNGWQTPTGEDWRQAFRRARWYLRRAAGEEALGFDIRAPGGGPFSFFLNGAPAAEVELSAGAWRPIRLDLTSAPISRPFAVELRMSVPGERFETGLFQVRARRFLSPGERL